MKDLNKNILAIFGGLFSALMLGFTGWNTYDLILSVTGNWLVSICGFVAFEVGMVYWMFSTIHTAEGLGQLAIASFMSVVNTFFVSAATLLHLGAVSASTFGGSTVEVLVGVAVVANLSAKGAYLFAKPERLQAIRQRALMGKLEAAVNARVELLMSENQEPEVQALALEQFGRLIIDNRNRLQQRNKDNDNMLTANLEPVYATVAPDIDDTQPIPVVKVDESVNFQQPLNL
jgi:hypothetical protein